MLKKYEILKLNKDTIHVNKILEQNNFSEKIYFDIIVILIFYLAIITIYSYT